MQDKTLAKWTLEELSAYCNSADCTQCLFKENLKCNMNDGPELPLRWDFQKLSFDWHKFRFKNEAFSSLIQLNYEHDTAQGGWLSPMRSIIIVENRSPYKGQVLPYFHLNTEEARYAYQFELARLKVLDLIEKESEKWEI